MLVIGSFDQIPQPLRYPVLTIGVFDGVHRGHQRIIRSTVERARQADGTALVLSFDPHPQKAISPDTAPALLQTRRQKREALAGMGVDIFINLPFSRELSLLSPEQFVREILFNHGVREILVGTNFRFGHRRAGDFNLLQSVSAPLGIKVEGIEPVTFRESRISSTRVRNLLAEGRVSLVRRLLGRPYEVRGTVIRGAGRGRELGFPTANLESENELIPAPGVYAGQARVGDERHVCVVNIGFRPTLYRRRAAVPLIEAFLLDFASDLYGTAIGLEFCLRLRAEQRFDSVGELKKQIERDVRITRQYLAQIRSVEFRESPGEFRGHET